MVTIKPPFTLDFDVQRSLFSGQNNFSLKIYNLAPNTRNLMRKDDISYQFSQADFRPVVLRAGYGANMSKIVVGNCIQCYSTREGVDYTTQVTGFDAGIAFANGVTSATFTSDNTTRTEIVTALAKSLPKTSLGSISQTVMQGSIPRGNSYSGNTCSILSEITGGAFFVDNGVVHVLGESESTDDETIVIDSSSGLLGTPTRERLIVHMSVIFDARIRVGQQVVLQSFTDKSFNAVYKVLGVHHRGIISRAVCGDAITELSLQKGTYTKVPRAS